MLNQSHDSDDYPFWKIFHFEQWSTRRLRDMSVLIAKDLDVIEMLIHDRSLSYLDLAVKSYVRASRRDKVKFEIIRYLPQACTEFLIAESEIHKTTSLGRLFAVVNQFQQSWLRKCDFNRICVVRVWYELYTRIFFERFESMDGNEKRASIRALLNTYRILQINTFSVTHYQSLIRECTSPESDPALTVELLRILCNSNRLRIRAFEYAPRECLETMLCHAQVMRFDFWGLWRGIGDLSARFNPIAEYIIRGRNHCTIILLKYGFPYSFQEEVYEKQCYLLITGRLWNRFINTYEEYNQLKRKFNRARMMLIMTTFLAFDDFDGTGTMPPISPPTLVWLMRCVTEPYVLPSEMLREIKPFIPTYYEDLRRIADRYETANIYKVDNTDLVDYTVYAPRKLQHLCRCAIRRAIANNLRLPVGIEELEVPNKFKAFLKIELEL